MKKRPVNGWLILDKPYGLSSTQALGRARFFLGAAKAGHAGTLDPLASGLLPIAFGEATKLVAWAMSGKKIYHFTVQWGEERDTDDEEGKPTYVSHIRPNWEEIVRILPDFTGEILQAPPRFSAIKLQGHRAYDLARAGAEVILEKRPIFVEDLQLMAVKQESADFTVSCGKGTYIRALARDMGRALGCFGYIRALRRIAVGPFCATQMISLESLEEISHKGTRPCALDGAVFPVDTVLDGIPALVIDDEEALRLKQGQTIALRDVGTVVCQDVVLVRYAGKAFGLCLVAQDRLKPKRLFNL